MSDSQSAAPSLIDRFAETVPQSVRDLKSSIVEDLANLLNTRATCAEWSDDLAELESTIVNYGLPDFAGRDFASVADRETLRAAITTVIDRFEPRLGNVRVQLSNDGQPLNGNVSFEIEATVKAAPDDPLVVGLQLAEPTGMFNASSHS